MRVKNIWLFSELRFKIMFKKMSKPINLLKLSWVIFFVGSLGFLISSALTSYQSKVIDEPSWMLCEAGKGLKKLQYIKFHNTKKVIYNIYQQRWVEDKIGRASCRERV